MQLIGTYRHELKYPLSEAGYQALSRRLSAVMRRDVHAGADGLYTVRSIYFDNYRDKALREKLDGVPQREKFRIRWYNNDLSFLSLEKKCKYNDLCQKLDAPLTRAELQAILSGGGAWMDAHPEALVRELSHAMTAQQLRPRVLVSYMREAYTYAPGNVRVTFDFCVRSSLFHPDLLCGAFPDIGVLDAPGSYILEVKYDAFLPDVIACLLQSGDLRQQAFSKYAACRRFG